MKKFIQKLFSKEKINVGRQYEIDLLRGFTLILIIICHTGLYLTSYGDSFTYYFCDLIGSEPCAPVFMVLLGISVLFYKDQSAGRFLKRGLKLFIASCLLNIARSFPYFFTGDIDYFASIQGFFVIDIYQLAGLTFLLFALFKKLKMPYWSMFIVSIVFLITGTALMYIPHALEFSTEATYVLNLFLPLNNDWCCFNLSTWFIYPCFGLMIGELLVRCKNKNLFYIILLCIGSLGAIALYLNIGLRFPNYLDYYAGGNYYRMGILNTLITMLFACFLLSIWYFMGKILPNFIKKYLTFLSKNITAIYIASWLILSPILHIQSYNGITFPNISLWGMMVVITALCSVIALGYSKIKAYFKNRNKTVPIN